MKVIVSVCERVAVDSGWETHPGTDSVTEVVVLDSPISMKQLRFGLTKSKFENWNLGLPCKDPFEGKLHWIEISVSNFSDDFVSFHAETNDDGSMMLSLAAWPDSERKENADGKTAEEGIPESGYPGIRMDSQDSTTAERVNVTEASESAAGIEAVIDSDKQIPSAVEATTEDHLKSENHHPHGHHPKHEHHYHHMPHHHHGPHHRPFSRGPGGPPHHHQFGPRGVPIAHPYGHGPFGRGCGHGPFGRGYGHGPFGRGGGHGIFGRGGGHQKKGRKIQALARFIEHLTLPDDSTILPGEKCVKIWSVRNDSLMAWPEKCELVQVGGSNLLSSSKSVPVVGGLKPDEIQHISLELTFPEQNGLYHAFFRLRAIDPATNEPGFKFGQRLWVKVMVAKPGNASRLTKHKRSSSSSSSSFSSSSSDSSSDFGGDGADNHPHQRQRRQRKAEQKANKKRKKLNKRDKSIMKLQKQCSKLKKKLERKSQKLERLLSAKAEAGHRETAP